MADETTTVNSGTGSSGKGSGMSKDEIALELMRFIANTTGVGRPGSGAGFAGKTSKSPEDQVDVLLQLYERCRGIVGK